MIPQDSMMICNPWHLMVDIAMIANIPWHLKAVQFMSLTFSLIRASTLRGHGFQWTKRSAPFFQAHKGGVSAKGLTNVFCKPGVFMFKYTHTHIYINTPSIHIYTAYTCMLRSSVLHYTALWFLESLTHFDSSTPQEPWESNHFLAWENRKAIRMWPCLRLKKEGVSTVLGHSQKCSQKWPKPW